MRVLGNKVLVKAKDERTNGALVVVKLKDLGEVFAVGDNVQSLVKGEKVMFGIEYDEIQIEQGDNKISLLVMDKENIKVVL